MTGIVAADFQTILFFCSLYKYLCCVYFLFVWFFFSPAQSTIFFLLAWNYFCFLTVSCLESCFLFYPLFCFVLFWQATGVCLCSWLAGSWAPVLLVALAPDAVSLWKTYLSVAELGYCSVDPTSAKVAFNSHPDLYMKQVQEDGKLSGIGKKEQWQRLGFPVLNCPEVELRPRCPSVPPQTWAPWPSLPPGEGCGS